MGVAAGIALKKWRHIAAIFKFYNLSLISCPVLVWQLLKE